MSAIFIGTSGWSYKGWEKTFYPSKVPVREHFKYYATQFPTVEVNLTFYRLPKPAMVQGWINKAPSGFVYAVKGSRFITHMKKLTGLDGAVDRYFERIEPMRHLVGAVLWQLPPMLRNDPVRLESFLKVLPAGYRYAVEFRHGSWLNRDTYDILTEHRAAFVSVSSLAMPVDLTVTTDLVYIRFHGLQGGAAHDYTEEELEPWARHIRRQSRLGRTVFAYFNNDWNVRAPANARLLMAMTGSGTIQAFARAA